MTENDAALTDDARSRVQAVLEQLFDGVLQAQNDLTRMDSVYRGLVDRYEFAGEEGTASQSRLTRVVVRWFCSSRLMVDPAEAAAVSRDDVVILRVSFTRCKNLVACHDPNCGCEIVWCMMYDVCYCTLLKSRS
jgi:hypothetical protein